MLLFGHAGITLGAAILINGAAKSYFAKHTDAKTESATQPEHQGQNASGILSSLSGSFDIRVLMIGSLLPDIIDKPVGHLLLSSTLNNGRIVAHTLLFTLLLFVAGLYLYRNKRKNWLLTLSSGTLSHLIMDTMWLQPRTLLWPLFGWTFPPDMGKFWAGILHELLTNPATYVPELVGLAIVIWFAWIIVRARLTLVFLKNGRV